MKFEEHVKDVVDNLSNRGAIRVAYNGDAVVTLTQEGDGLFFVNVGSQYFDPLDDNASAESIDWGEARLYDSLTDAREDFERKVHVHGVSEAVK